MKKGTKGMLIAAGAFAVAGIGLCIGGISAAAVETGGNVFDQAGQLLQDNDYPLAGLIHWGNVQYHSSDIDWDALDGNTVDMDFATAGICNRDFPGSFLNDHIVLRKVTDFFQKIVYRNKKEEQA